jgi:hypothetical protein
MRTVDYKNNIVKVLMHFNSLSEGIDHEDYVALFNKYRRKLYEACNAYMEHLGYSRDDSYGFGKTEHFIVDNRTGKTIKTEKDYGGKMAGYYRDNDQSWKVVNFALSNHIVICFVLELLNGELPEPIKTLNKEFE